MLYSFFWVTPRRLNFICRRFGTHCLFHLYRSCKQDRFFSLTYLLLSSTRTHALPVLDSLRLAQAILSQTFFPVALRPNAGHGLLMLEVSRSHTTTHHSRQDSSGRVISPSQRLQPDNTQHSTQTNIHAPGGIRSHNPNKRAAVDLRLRPPCH